MGNRWPYFKPVVGIKDMKAEIKMFCDRLSKSKPVRASDHQGPRRRERDRRAEGAPATFKMISLCEIMETVTGTKPIVKELESANLKSPAPVMDRLGSRIRLAIHHCPARHGVKLTELIKETLQKRYNGRVSPCKAFDSDSNSVVDHILQSDIVESHFDHEILV
ncbi:hypothetical protein L596_017538 [Steinernema carpocapsae]|uniref:Uncharacterized protein n=1 Tax=Steinernema carpocapsae TaxID=34508 RepID=A0A4U5N200_STECR|nr:hypothetical protein L596_017538 [Steinernema carpocapsae]